MKLIRCDRCRRELAVDLEAGQSLREVKDYVPVTVGAVAMNLAAGKTYDLCSDCAKATERFLTDPSPEAPR